MTKFELNDPLSGAPDKTRVHFTGGHDATVAARELTDTSTAEIAYRQIPGATAPQDTWALTIEGQPLTDTHRAEIGAAAGAAIVRADEIMQEHLAKHPVNQGK